MPLYALQRQAGMTKISHTVQRRPALVFDGDSEPDNTGSIKPGVVLEEHHIKSDPDLILWAILVGEEGGGRRWLTKLCVSGVPSDSKFPTINVAEITDSRNGLAKLRNSERRQPTDEFCIIVLRPELALRGKIQYMGDIVGWRADDKGWTATYSDSPLQHIAVGEIGLGAAAGDLGHAEQYVSVLPRGQVLTVRRTGKLSHEQWSTLYYYFDGARMYVATAEEREKLAQNGLMPARLPKVDGAVA